MKHVPKKIPEGINVTPVHPFSNFLQLLLVVGLLCAIGFYGTGFLADFIAPRLSFEQESKLGTWMGQDALQDTSEHAALNQLMRKIRPVDWSEELTVQARVSNHGQPNAFVMVGGRILVTQGLLEAVGSENELAFVLGHEMGHYFHRHSVKRLGRGLLFGLLFSSFLPGDEVSDFIQSSFNIGSRSYDREQELEADRFGAEVIQNVYGHIGAAKDFFETLGRGKSSFQKGVEERLSYFSTHPLDDDRVQAIHRLAIEKNWELDGDRTRLSPAFGILNKGDGS